MTDNARVEATGLTELAGLIETYKAETILTNEEWGVCVGALRFQAAALAAADRLSPPSHAEALEIVRKLGRPLIINGEREQAELCLRFMREVEPKPYDALADFNAFVGDERGEK